jgi:hypothetical protein
MTFRFSVRETAFSRRAFVTEAGALVVVFGFAGSVLAGRALARVSPVPAGVDPGQVDSWLAIATHRVSWSERSRIAGHRPSRSTRTAKQGTPYDNRRTS